MIRNGILIISPCNFTRFYLKKNGSTNTCSIGHPYVQTVFMSIAK